MIDRFCQDDRPPEERRKNPLICPLGDEAIVSIHRDMGDLRDRLTALQQSVTSYMEKQISALEAFPHKDGKPDVDGHRSYHEALIEQSKARTEFWHKMTFELVRWGLLGFILWAARELWIAFLHGPAK